jgi:hypothetical protein
VRQVLFLIGIAVAIGAVLWQRANFMPADSAVEREISPPEGSSTPAAATGAPRFRVTDELIEDGWVDATRTAGADLKPLEHSSSSVCFLTKIEIKGVQGPEDANSCAIGIDEFTGYWQVTAEVAEGGHSQVRCNARCLVWE